MFFVFSQTSLISPGDGGQTEKKGMCKMKTAIFAVLVLFVSSYAMAEELIEPWANYGIGTIGLTPVFNQKFQLDHYFFVVTVDSGQTNTLWDKKMGGLRGTLEGELRVDMGSDTCRVVASNLLRRVDGASTRNFNSKNFGFPYSHMEIAVASTAHGVIRTLVSFFVPSSVWEFMMESHSGETITYLFVRR